MSWRFWLLKILVDDIDEVSIVKYIVFDVCGDNC